MAGAFDGLAVRAEQLSHTDVTGVGYGICTFYPEGADENRHFLDAYLAKREKELEQPALVGVLSQVRGVLCSPTGYTQDLKARGPCLSLVLPMTIGPLCVPAAMSTASATPHL